MKSPSDHVLDYFGQIKEALVTKMPNSEADIETFCLMQVMEDVTDEGFTRLSKMLRYRIPLPPGVYAPRDPVSLEISIPALQEILDKVIMYATPGCSVVLADSGIEFQVLLKRNKEGDARHIYSSESIQEPI